MTDIVDDKFTIDLARDFSPTPLGRTRRQGRFSGEAFREDILRPSLSKHHAVIVDLDGASGLSTGFLDEAFAGLVRDRTLNALEFWQRVSIICRRDRFIIDEVRRFVDRAEALSGVSAKN